jgi:UDP-N-acetylglucosamine--N-acetylmuramyl-(pentapeptide) pyrophosphoryl-undecaprenol N-acetylglucosamine transferase
MKILMTCGGTGGHIFPAIALAEELRKRGCPDSVFVVDKASSAADIINDAGFKYHVLDVPKMPYGISFRWLSFILRLVRARLDAAAVVAGIGPDIAVGFGAYVSGPVIQAAASMGIKTLIHEQNALLGRANRILFRNADKVCFSFNSPLIKKHEKCILTGNPIRQSIIDGFKMITRQEALSALGLSYNKKTLLVLGGSKGSLAINKIMHDMVNVLDEDEKRLIQIIHITGYKDAEAIGQAYRINKIRHWVRGFYDKMAVCLKAADLAVCRAGGATIAEAALFGVPAIFIPYPFAGRHQSLNALSISRQGGAVSLPEKKLSHQSLKKEIFSIITDESSIRQMSSNIRLFAKPYAAKALADQVMELVDVKQP